MRRGGLERDRWTKELSGLTDVELRWWESLARYTTFRVGGPVRCLARPRGAAAFQSLIRRARQAGLPFMVMGRGSNVLAPDEPWNMLVIQPQLAFADVRIENRGSDGVEVLVGSGVTLARLLRFCIRWDLAGVEPLVGIPATMGGALTMNAGTPAGAISDHLKWVDGLDRSGESRRLHRSDLSPRYRSLGLPGEWVVTGGCLLLQPCPGKVVSERLREAMRRRKETQPLGRPSAGCVFKNPPGQFAGALIERCGLKGRTIGGAEVSVKHANWIINRGHARAADIVRLMALIQERVWNRFQVRLEPEIEVLGHVQEAQSLSA